MKGFSWKNMIIDNETPAYSLAGCPGLAPSELSKRNMRLEIQTTTCQFAQARYNSFDTYS